LSIAVKLQFVLHHVSACPCSKSYRTQTVFHQFSVFYSFCFPLCFFKARELSSVMPLNLDSYQGVAVVCWEVFITFMTFTFFASL